jgi:hypothetical protein
MMEEIKELFQEMKSVSLCFGLAAMLVSMLLLYNIKFAVHREPVKTVQVDYCWISYRAQAVDQYGLPHIVWTKGFGPCSQLDRYENT